jgi:hypothetical protein
MATTFFSRRSEVESIRRFRAFVPWFQLPKRNGISPQDPDSEPSAVSHTVLETQAGRQERELAPFAAKLAASQIALRANLVANQFESGLDSAFNENWDIKQGCHKRKYERLPEKEIK